MYTDRPAWTATRCCAHRRSSALNPDPVDKQRVNRVNIVLRSCQFISGLQTCSFVSWERENGHLSRRRLHASPIKLLNPRDNDNNCSRSLTHPWHEPTTQMLISCFTMVSNAGVALQVFCLAFSTFSLYRLGPHDWWHPMWLSERALICHNCHRILSNLGVLFNSEIY